jgi:hypothetical protein
MTNSAITRRNQSLPAISAEITAGLQGASTRAITAFSSANGNTGNIIAALDVAMGIQELRQLLDRSEIMARIQALQDTPLGFRTDRDPKVVNRRTGQPNRPYEYPVVRDACIEAMLRGLQLVGNHFNIISDRCYVTKEGFECLIRLLPDVVDFCPTIGVPQTKNGGAIVDCSANWLQGGKPMTVAAQIPVKGSDASTADQYIGKATRKLLKRCYEVMTGNSLPEGDAADMEPMTATTSRPGLAVAPQVALPAQSAPITPQQLQQLTAALGRQLTAVGQAAFLADACTASGVSKATELAAESFSALMSSLSDAGARERWNRGCCAATGDPILTDELIASLQAQDQAQDQAQGQGQPREAAEPEPGPEPTRAAARVTRQAAATAATAPAAAAAPQPEQQQPPAGGDDAAVVAVQSELV